MGTLAVETKPFLPPPSVKPYGIRLLMQIPNSLYRVTFFVHHVCAMHPLSLFYRFPARLCILPKFSGIFFCVIYIYIFIIFFPSVCASYLYFLAFAFVLYIDIYVHIYIYIYIPSVCRFCFDFVVLFLCSRCSLADFPVQQTPYVPDWQPRTILCIVEARSVNAKITHSHTHTHNPLGGSMRVA